MSELKTYRATGTVDWITQTDAVLLVDKNHQVVERLEYPDAALWDFVVRVIPIKRTVTMLRWVGNFDSNEIAENHIRETLARWVANGWLKIK